MTDDDLGCIESRANAASPGPWVFDERGAIIRGPEGRVAGSAMVLGFHENMEFIAAARDDVPELVAEVRRLREELATSQRVAKGLAMAALEDVNSKAEG